MRLFCRCCFIICCTSAEYNKFSNLHILIHLYTVVRILLWSGFVESDFAMVRDVMESDCVISHNAPVLFCKQTHMTCKLGDDGLDICSLFLCCHISSDKNISSKLYPEDRFELQHHHFGLHF